MTNNMHTDPITFVTINVWFGMDGRGIFKIGDYENRSRKTSRFEALIDGITKIDPHVIAIQEANKLPAYAKKIARALNYDAVWKVQNSGLKILGWGIPVNFTAGNVILAKKDCHLKYIASHRLSGRGIQLNSFSAHFKEIRNAMAAVVEICGQSVVIFNTQTHFSLIMGAKWEKAVDNMRDNGDITTQQSDTIKKQLFESHNRTEHDVLEMLEFIQRIRKNYGLPFVVMGDFNTTLESKAMKRMVDILELLDPFGIKNPDADGYTWDPDRNTNTAFDGSPFWADGKTPRDLIMRLAAQFDASTPRRIDFILLSKHFSPDMIRLADLVFTEPVNNLFVSDHFGVRVVLNELPS
jgi:endonuclease/exonuclease/phosphatase family metal-dependent hydrolase